MTDLSITDLGSFESPPAQSRARGTWRRMTKGWLRPVLLTLLAALMIYPLIWLFVSSFNEEVNLADAGLRFDNLSTGNYTDGWTARRFGFHRYMWNTALLVLGAIVGNLISCSLAAYAFARLDFIGKRLLFATMLSTILLPIHVVIVPQFILFSKLGWLDTFLPLVVPKFLATDAFFIFLMVQFIRGIPRELDEAARIDGAGHFRIFWSVILPLMTPALATAAIFTFIWTWSDFFSQLIYLSSEENFTVSLALRAFLDASSTSDFGSMFAMSIVSLLPLFIAFLIGQRFLVHGISTSGLK